jgi:hypothetical protein
VRACRRRWRGRSRISCHSGLGCFQRLICALIRLHLYIAIVVLGTYLIDVHLFAGVSGPFGFVVAVIELVI